MWRRLALLHRRRALQGGLEPGCRGLERGDLVLQLGYMCPFNRRFSGSAGVPSQHNSSADHTTSWPWPEGC
ncbi:hypothetical protein [Streptomyces sp. PAN_FS17]|uniref:hypothetical protein n=1 Tax=Streptomyces sp. PAN_FS17 TaxID=1855351 RepID=UPI0015A55994|nr:hypothetical protein [Streptomyces sp. PAN_FS17]